MTASNHVLTGATIAVAAQDPWVVVPAALASHFVLDAIPHFGVYSHDAKLRNQSLLFRYVVLMDVLITAALLIFLPLVLSPFMHWWVVLLGMVFAFLPDAVWVKSYIRDEVKDRYQVAKHWVTIMHKRIQLFEKPIGIVVELVWFFGMSVILSLLVTGL